MFKLAAPPKLFQSDYKKARKKAFEKIVNEPSFDPVVSCGQPWAKLFIDHLESELDAILVGNPQELIKQINTISADPNFKNFAAFCALPKKPKIHAMQPLFKLVMKLFDYDAMCDDAVNGAYALVKIHGHRICPYCNMHHLNFHIGSSKKTLKLRPPLDHFFPRSVYPYLGTSLFNLVPSCEQCNSRIKLAKDPRGAALPNPLAHPFDTKVQLSFQSAWTSPLPLSKIRSGKDFQFKLTGKNAASQEFADFFRLVERYSWYENELLDLVGKCRRLLDYDPKMAGAITQKVNFVLGFPEKEAGNRAVGLMLADAAHLMLKTNLTGTKPK